MTPNTLGDLREHWIARLNGDPALQGLSVHFEETPSVPVADLEVGIRRGYVAVLDEDDSGGVIEALLVTSVVGGSIGAKAGLQLIDAARMALIDLASVACDEAGTDSGIGAIVDSIAFRRSSPASDGEGRRVYTARHFFFAVRYVNPLPQTLS